MTRESEFDAVLVDLDGTLLDDQGTVRPRNRETLRALESLGVHVMLATGRSTTATLPVLESVGLRSPLLSFNGSAIHCPQEGRHIEERVLSNRVVARALAHGRERGYLTQVQLADGKFATRPRNTSEERALCFFEDLQHVDEFDELPTEYVIRVIFYSDQHQDSIAFRDELSGTLIDPLFLTDFPLNLLVTHRESLLQVVDVHSPSRGKAEGLRFLKESFGVPADRVVAIGDASNDVHMLEAAGLGVAMADCCPRARSAADRVIGGNNSDAIADLLHEVFGLSSC